MPARTPREAVRAFLAPLNRAIASFTSAQLAGGDAPNVDHALIFRPTRYARLAGYLDPLSDPVELRFSLAHNYKVTQTDGGWTVHTQGYTYQFELDDGQEIVIYHYDPRSASKVKTPHLHVRGLDKPFDLGKAHFPTGRVSIEEVLRFAVRELGVRPRATNWQTILEETERAFHEKKTW